MEQGFLMVGYGQPLQIRPQRWLARWGGAGTEAARNSRAMQCAPHPHPTHPPVRARARYSTIYTMAPVFSLVLDRDVTDSMAMMYPELYRELLKGRALSVKNFLLWVLVSVYQGLAHRGPSARQTPLC